MSEETRQESVLHTGDFSLSRDQLSFLPIEKHSPIALMQSLITTLDLEQLISNFYKHSSTVSGYTGLDYDFNETKIKFGQTTKHLLKYTLSFSDDWLGNISFYLAKEPDKHDITHIENLLSLLVYPVRNLVYYQRAQSLALTDHATNLGNQKSLFETLARELATVKRSHDALTMLLIDGDGFKMINDEYGHLAGDKAILTISESITSIVRSCDRVFRYGGDEFAVLLGRSMTEDACHISERIRQSIAEQVIQHESSVFTISISTGITSAKYNDTPNSFFKRADDALYLAKSKGHGQIEIST